MTEPAREPGRGPRPEHRRSRRHGSTPAQRRRPRAPSRRGESRVGERLTVDLGPVAAGGHVVARSEGVVVFVRHGLPGERAVVKVTEGDTGSRFLRADAVEIVRGSPDRVTPPCPFAGPGLCGGCDFQHVSVPAQRELKAAVVTEQMRRLAGLEVAVRVDQVPGDENGLGWRTRMQFAVDASGRAGLRKHRSTDVVQIDRCLIASPALAEVTALRWEGAETVESIVSSEGERLRLVTASDRMFADGPEVLHERAGGMTWRVTGSGFWQVHPGAADALGGAVVDLLAPRPGETAWDLYAGVGLFAGLLAERVGPGGRVVAVEGDSRAAEDASANLADLAAVEVVHERVDRFLRAAGMTASASADAPASTAGRGAVGHVDVVVLDPPRAGAKRAVVEAIAAAAPRAVVYVACDPASLARDVATFASCGYDLTTLRAFDLFPMTHHVECVALLTKTGSDLR